MNDRSKMITHAIKADAKTTGYRQFIETFVTVAEKRSILYVRLLNWQHSIGSAKYMPYYSNFVYP